MSHINVTINGRQYRMACEEGQEVRLLKLAVFSDQHPNVLDIITGGLVPPVKVAPGDAIRTTVDPLGTLELSFV